MGQVVGTNSTYGTKGIKEDLADVIYDITPEDTPFMSNAGRTTVDQTFFEWQTDSLASPDLANKHIEGDEASFAVPARTVRLGNRTQISGKTAIISGTNEVVKKAGRKSEMAYQISKRSAELKRDMESISLANQGAVAGDDSTARETGSFLAFIKTNVDKASDGSNPTYSTVVDGERVDGTQRAFSETIVKNVISLLWNSGGKVKTLMVGSFQKAAFSAFAGIAQIRKAVDGQSQATIVGAADAYVSDFGVLTLVPNRFMRTRDALFIDPEYVQFGFLRNFFTEKLAKTGDAEKRQILVEWGVKVGTEIAHGGAFDLATS